MISAETSSLREQLLQQRDGLLRTFNNTIVQETETKKWDASFTEDEELLADLRVFTMMERILEVDAALELLDDRELGLCRACGERIEATRLLLDPEEPFCDECSAELAREESGRSEEGAA